MLPGTDRVSENQEPFRDDFAVRAGRFVCPCGAFFALKIQKATSPKQLEEFSKEAANLEKLRGHSNIVQIRDHAIVNQHVVILMELAACDLQSFFRRSEYSFDISGMLSIWHSLVKAVDAAHKQEIIHRDLKPGNFLLVPIAPPFAEKILATTTVPPEKFEFRIVNKFGQLQRDADEMVPNNMPDVELILRDQETGLVAHTLHLVLKVSDFGLASPLDPDLSHLSVRGHAGTLKYMAPETFRPSADGVQRLCKRVDVWALGVILFQMLGEGRTPYDRYCTKDNFIGAAVAIQSEVIHKEVMKFDRCKIWAGERERLEKDLRAWEGANGDGYRSANVCRSATAVSLLSTEFLFRICKKCLAFEACDRVETGDLKKWVGDLLDGDWWKQTMEGLGDVGVQALLAGVSSVKDHESEADAENLDGENLVQRGVFNARIEQVFFPELRRLPIPSASGTMMASDEESSASRGARRPRKRPPPATQFPFPGTNLSTCFPPRNVVAVVFLIAIVFTIVLAVGLYFLILPSGRMESKLVEESLPGDGGMVPTGEVPVSSVAAWSKPIISGGGSFLAPTAGVGGGGSGGGNVLAPSAGGGGNNVLAPSAGVGRTASSPAPRPVVASASRLVGASAPPRDPSAVPKAGPSTPAPERRCAAGDPTGLGPHSKAASEAVPQHSSTEAPSIARIVLGPKAGPEDHKPSAGSPGVPGKAACMASHGRPRPIATRCVDGVEIAPPGGPALSQQVPTAGAAPLSFSTGLGLSPPPPARGPPPRRCTPADNRSVLEAPPAPLLHAPSNASASTGVEGGRIMAWDASDEGEGHTGRGPHPTRDTGTGAASTTDEGRTAAASTDEGRPRMSRAALASRRRGENRLRQSVEFQANQIRVHRRGTELLHLHPRTRAAQFGGMPV